MFTLLDLIRAAQGGAALNNMARQFGLSVEQTQRALEALMPAFALAFQRNASDPMGFSNLMRMMTSGQYATFFDQPAQAFTPWGINQGNDVVRQLFGPEVSRLVAQQTAAWTGIAPDIMKQMLPVTAAMLMGGLFRSAATEGLADFFESLADALRGKDGRRERAAAAAMPYPFSVWTSMMEGLTGAGAARPERKPSETRSDQPNPFGPWGEMMNAILGINRPQPARPEPPPRPNAAEEAKPESPANPAQFFTGLFEAGIEAQQQQLAALQNIFDAYWGTDRQRK